MTAVAGVKRTNESLGPEHLEKIEQPALKRRKSLSSAELCMMEGQTLQKANRFVDAIKKFHQALDAPDATQRIKASVWNYIGHTQNDLGNMDEAVNACRQAYKFAALTPEDPLINLASSCNLCDVLIRRGTNQDLDEAVKICKQLLENLDTIKTSPKLVAKIYLNLTSAYLARNAEGDNEAVLKYAQIGLALKLDDPDMRGWFLCDKGDALRRLNKFEDALHSYAEGMELYSQLDAGLKVRMKNRFAMTLKGQIKEKLTEQSKIAEKIAELEQSKASVADQLENLKAALQKTTALT